MRYLLTSTKKNWGKVLTAAISTFCGFVLLYPEVFDKWPLVVKVSNYVAAGGLAGFGVVGVRNVYRRAPGDVKK